MGGRRTTKEELTQLEALTKEGLTTREVAQKLGRSEAAIRNLRYKKRLITRAEGENKVLLKQKDELLKSMSGLRNELKNLEERKSSLERGIAALESKTKWAQMISSLTYNPTFESHLIQRFMDLQHNHPELFPLFTDDELASAITKVLKNWH
jgi:IS30 family transposase